MQRFTYIVAHQKTWEGKKGKEITAYLSSQREMTIYILAYNVKNSSHLHL